MGDLNVLPLLLTFLHLSLSLGDHPTIEEQELIAHELVNPFTPYFRDPKYQGKRICSGFASWQDAIFDNYKKLKTKFTRNCSHILGNLFISEIGPDHDVDFLNTIEEVSGYVFIHRVTKTHFSLPNLRLIRGEEAVQIRGQNFSLLVTETYSSKDKFLIEIAFPSLEAILTHGVGFFDNPGLCYAPFSVNWDDILEYPELQPVVLVPTSDPSATADWSAACESRFNAASGTTLTSAPYFTTPSGHQVDNNGLQTENDALPYQNVSSQQEIRQVTSVGEVTEPILLSTWIDTSTSGPTTSTGITIAGMHQNLDSEVEQNGETPSRASGVDKNSIDLTIDNEERRNMSINGSAVSENTGIVSSSNGTPNFMEKATVNEPAETKQLKTDVQPSNDTAASMIKEGSNTTGALRHLVEFIKEDIALASTKNSVQVETRLNWKCDDACPVHNGKSFCWGPSANQCQTLRKCQTRVCRGPNRCVTEGEIEECCHEECAGGCSGTRASECMACRRYSQDGNCVAACLPTRYYNIHTSSWEPNPNGKVSLGHVCVASCPDGFLRDRDHCVLKCSRPGTQKAGKVCVQCPKTGCPKVCSAKQLQAPTIDFLYKSLLHKMENCTSWEGSLILKRQSFEGDAFNNLTKEKESVNFADLKRGLGNLVEITGGLYIGTDNWAHWLRNLTFLSKLRRIGGETQRGYESPLSIIHNRHLEYLGLSSLTFVGVRKGGIHIAYNPKLCFVDTINWQQLMWSPAALRTRMVRRQRQVAFPVTFPNRPTVDCVAEGQQCDASVCALADGCWGPGPENCFTCAHWYIQDRGEPNRCVRNCSLIDGGYYPVVVTKITGANTTTERRLCARCHTECGSAAGACYGPGADQCNHGCAHVKDGDFCRPQCPITKYPDKNNTCQECATACSSYAQTSVSDVEPTNGSEVCTGPGDWFGQGGCSHCLQVIATATVESENSSGLPCLTAYQACPSGTFLYLIGVPRNGQGSAQTRIASDSSLVSLPAAVKTRLAEWLASHQRGGGGAVTARVCAPCHAECRDGCSGPSPNQCVRCRRAKFQGRCVAECREDTYKVSLRNDEVICLPCHVECSQGCRGPSNADCFACRHYKLYPHKNRTQWICVETCPAGSAIHMERGTNSTVMEAVCHSTEEFPILQPDSSAHPSDHFLFGDWTDVISPRLLHNLSWVSTGLLAFTGLLALILGLCFAYACARIVVRGTKMRSGLGESQSKESLLMQCDRFWMKAILVAEPHYEQTGKMAKLRKKRNRAASHLKRTTINTGDERGPAISPNSDTMPDMATLLIIPECQLQLGSRVGGGAFGSVFRGVWFKGPLSPGFAKKVTELLATVDCAKPQFVTSDSLVEDTTYACTEREYLTVEEDTSVDEMNSPEQHSAPRQDSPRQEFQFTELVAETGKTEGDSEKEGEESQIEGVEKRVVAIKVLNDEADPSTCKALLEEARVMATVNHPCCLRLLALCMTARPQLVTSFLPLGCLLSYLHRFGGPAKIDRDAITPHMMLNWAAQIASGMAYLASRGIIHRDLAARNVLVETPEQIKITDFGLAKCIEDADGEYKAKGGLMPIKWLAIECIKKRVFSSKSDVWAYGVTLWEVFTFGRKPFERIPARHLIHHLESGLRLNQPSTVSLDLYALMVECWQEDPERRPEFGELFQRVSFMQLDAERFLSFEPGRSRLWSDSGLTASTSDAFATSLLNTESISTTNTSTINRSKLSSETLAITATSSYLNYFGRDNDGVRYTSPPSDDRYGVMMATVTRQQQPTEPLECISEHIEVKHLVQWQSNSYKFRSTLEIGIIGCH
uniref:receptor protein-tyrosine kinase n=1 Tax=Mesocestoides corti TaxID=53468 RepID=A0A5K3FKI9_MESCO